MTGKSVYITNGAFLHDVRAMFTERGFSVVDDIELADILCLTGGADINPALYNEGNVATYGVNVRRDEIEKAAFERAVERGLFIFGICRGGQLANVLNGGRLWQHFEGHAYQHPMVDLKTGRSIITSSIHHQMFRPAPDAEIVATCNEATMKVAQFDSWRAGEGEDPDVEVCWYDKTRSLCIQGHPEVGPEPFTNYCFELMERYA